MTFIALASELARLVFPPLAYSRPTYATKSLVPAALRVMYPGTSTLLCGANLGKGSTMVERYVARKKENARRSDVRAATRGD
jgi:hypothetical protein